jgi:hypothetical protein
MQTIEPQTDQPGRLFAKDPARARSERIWGGLFCLIGIGLGYAGIQGNNVLTMAFGGVLVFIGLSCIAVADHRMYGPAPWLLSRRAGEDLLVWPAVGLRWIYRKFTNANRV